MSINLDGEGWRCWKSPRDHVGRNPTKLVQKLLGCSWDIAKSITGVDAIHVPDDFMGKVSSLMDPPKKQDNAPLVMPYEFKSFERGLPSSKPFVNYLQSRKRGFTSEQISTLSQTYGLRYCTSGAYHGRVMFPIKYNYNLVTWTGRSMYEVEELRYKTLSVNAEKAALEGYKPAVRAITDYLLWYDDLMTANANTLVLVEGPFDSLKVNVLGEDDGIAATCFFTMTPSDSQIDLLYELMPRFKRKYLLLDQGTLPMALGVITRLRPLGIQLRQLPKQFKDPGEIPTTDDLTKVLFDG